MKPETLINLRRINRTEFVNYPPPKGRGLDDKFWSAKALIQRPGEDPMWVPLTMRFTHPSYFLRRVAFIPT